MSPVLRAVITAAITGESSNSFSAVSLTALAIAACSGSKQTTELRYSR